MAKVDYAASAAQIVELVGGKENVTRVTHCITRVRFVLRGQSIAAANTEAISAVPGIIQVVEAGGQYQVVIGTTVEKMYDEVVAITGNTGGEVAADDGEAPAEKEKNPFKILIKTISGIIPAVFGTAVYTMGTSGIFAMPTARAGCLQVGHASESSLLRGPILRCAPCQRVRFVFQRHARQLASFSVVGIQPDWYR